MYLQKPYPRCIFCGERANSREHAIPAWIARRFGLKEVQLRYVETASFGVAPHKQPISVASYRKRIFCADCNTHFKHLEDAAIPIIEPLALGNALILSQEEQAIAALWGAKTGIAIVSSTPEFHELVPLNHRLTVRQLGEPHADMYVGYAPWRGRVHLFGGDHSLINEAVDPARGYRAYGAMLTFAKLALKVFGIFDPPVPGHILEGDWPSIKQVWPKRTGNLVWPPDGPPAREGNLGSLAQLVPLRSI